MSNVLVRSPHPIPSRRREVSLADRAATAIDEAAAFAARIRKPDGHWCVELESNTTITAEYVFLRVALGLELDAKRDAMVRYFFSQQKKDGSWGLASNLPGDVSTTAETYLALRMLGIATDDPRMQTAERFILIAGGLEKMRVFTRIFFAMFGLFPWSSVPALPPELALLPPWSPVNVFALASWARGTMVPLLVLCHHKPVYSLPNDGTSTWLDHLWLDPKNKHLPYSETLAATIRDDGLGWSAFFVAADRVVRAYEWSARRLSPSLGPLRRRALAACEKWMLDRQEPNGDWAGIFPPMLNVVLALHASGRPLDDRHLALGLSALERFAVEDESGYRIEPCQSPVWDTILMMIGLLDAGVRDPSLTRAREWIFERQIFAEHGDWRVYNPQGKPGGWAFEYTNTWYPDVDDTAAIVIGFLKHDPALRSNENIHRAVEWIVSMQNDDGGWAAFDRENDKEFLNRIPFSDMDALCDPSTPDIVGRVLEALGLLDDPRYQPVVDRALDYLRKSQERAGSWFGRWGVNYVYGTSNVLCALAYHPLPPQDEMVRRATDWLLRVQNADGGWGECLESYSNKALMGKGPSTASQTAWALMGLLAHLPARHEAIERGIRFLVERQNEAGSWDEEEFTGTGFPNHFYLRYNLYRHYFPLMALGRYVAKRREQAAHGRA